MTTVVAIAKAHVQSLENILAQRRQELANMQADIARLEQIVQEYAAVCDAAEKPTEEATE